MNGNNCNCSGFEHCVDLKGFGVQSDSMVFERVCVQTMNNKHGPNCSYMV